MKGLDTPILLRLLRGEPKVVALLRTWRSEELATTSVNLLELELIARADPSPGRDKRLAALDRLRRKLTILPFDEAAALEGAAAPRPIGGSPTAPSLMILGALLAGRCSEWVTLAEADFPRVPGLKVTTIPSPTSKKH